MLEAVQTLEGHTDRIWTLAWNPDGTLLATSGADKTIRLWAKEDKWNCVSILTGSHNKSIRSLSWSLCGTYLASASFDHTVCIWKSSPSGGWSAVVNLEGHESEVKCVAWSADGIYLASCGRDKTVWIWERATEETDDLESAENWDCSDVKSEHSKDVKRVVWHPQHPILASCSYDDTVKLFRKDNGDWNCYETLTAHESTVWSADFSKSGEYLVTCSDDKTVRFWKNHAHDKLPQLEANSWKCVSVIQGYHSRSIYDVAWSVLDDVIASASGDNSIAIYKLDTESETFSCNDKLSQSHDCDVNCVAWNPRMPGLLASGGDDRKIKLWEYHDEGMKPITIVDELMQALSQITTKTNNANYTFPTSLNVQNWHDLVEIISIMQSLKDEVYYDSERHDLEKFLQLKCYGSNPCVIDSSGLIFDEKSGCVTGLEINISDNTGEVKFKFELVVDSIFALKLPKRSVKLVTVNKDLFVLEKTGDLFQVLPSGERKFLLGHLFMLSDIQFVVSNDGGKILYILTSDRDEKIRITNWPDTFEIERFCFGHKSFVRRLIVVDENRFISIADQKDEICLWNLEKTRGGSDKPLYPERVFALDENAKKRIRLKS